MNVLAPRPALLPDPVAIAGAPQQDVARPDIVLLTQGHVLVFAIRRQGGRAIAPRRFLFRLDAPALLIGVGLDASDSALIGAPSPDAQLETVRFDPLSFETASAAAAAGKAMDERLIAAADRWVAALSAAAVLHLRLDPAPEHRVAAIGPQTLAAEQILAGGHDILWCRIAQGCGAVFDVEPVGGSLDAVPLAQGAWLRSFEAMTLEVAPTAELLVRGELERGLTAFSCAAERAIGVQLGLAAVDEMLRLDRQAARADAEIRRIHGDLGRMVGAQAPHRAAPKTNSPLFLTVAHLADRIDVRAQMPGSVRAAEADSEPALDDILRASGLRSRPLRLTESWWREGSGSFLGFRAADGAPLALIERHGRYLMRDIAGGTSHPVTAERAKDIRPDAVALYAGLPDRKLTLRDLVTFGFQDGGFDLFTLVFSAVVGAWMASIPSLLSRWIFDDLIPRQSRDLLIEAGVVLALLALLRGIVLCAGNLAFARLRGRASTWLKAALWDRLLRQPTGFITRYPAPDLALRLSTAENVVGAIHMTAQQSLATLGMLIANLATMFWLSPVAAGAALALIAVFGLGFWIAGEAQKQAFKGGEAAEGSVTVFVHAIVRGVRKLRLAGAEERAFVKWGDRFTRSRLKLINVRKINNVFTVFAAGYGIASLAVLFAVLAWMSGGDVGVGTFFGFITAFGLTIGSLTALGRATINAMFQLATLPYAQPLLDAIPEKLAARTRPGVLSGAIEVAQLGFRYRHDAEAVLGNVSFTVNPGECVGIVGPTGCGKSTLVKLLLGFEPPSAGAVLYDGQDLKNLDLDAVRGRIGTVLQRPQLMPTTIFENIRGITNASPEAVWEAVEIAGLKSDIDAMPMGLHTIVAEGACGFSGGQLQRIAIARAVLRKPAILILDEATSALDGAMQAQVTRNLAALACTRIVIAHRLSTLRGCDRIIVLQNGQVAETGTYSELLTRGGLFADMARHQHSP